jgi:hypothetical protein
MVGSAPDCYDDIIKKKFADASQRPVKQAQRMKNEVWE